MHGHDFHNVQLFHVVGVMTVLKYIRNLNIVFIFSCKFIANIHMQSSIMIFSPYCTVNYTSKTSSVLVITFQKVRYGIRGISFQDSERQQKCWTPSTSAFEHYGWPSFDCMQLYRGTYLDLRNYVPLTEMMKLMLYCYCFCCQALRKAFSISEETFSFGIVGLHSCGDLTPVLMHLFVQCPDARFINIVGCCYMKLTSGM